MNGRLCDVLIEDNIGCDPETGTAVFFGLVVWADAGMQDVINSVEGVHYVTSFGTCYHVSLDERYDVEFVKQEIKAAILCAPGKDKQ